MDASTAHQLHRSLEPAIGPEPAAALMDALAGCATKEDLRELEHKLVHEMDLRFEAIDRQFESVDRRLARIDDTLINLYAQYAGLVERVGADLRNANRNLFFQLAGLMILFMAAAGIIQR